MPYFKKDHFSGGRPSDAGFFTKTGEGTLTLNGLNTYSGPTTVSEGKSVVGDDAHGSARLGSIVTLNKGGMLGGIGTVGGIIVNAGAIVLPGNSIGTLSVAGNISYAGGPIYSV